MHRSAWKGASERGTGCRSGTGFEDAALAIDGPTCCLWFGRFHVHLLCCTYETCLQATRLLFFRRNDVACIVCEAILHVFVSRESVYTYAYISQKAHFCTCSTAWFMPPPRPVSPPWPACRPDPIQQPPADKAQPGGPRDRHGTE